MMFKTIDLFSGIGGFSLGLQWAGLSEPALFCEIEEYPQKLLRQNFPGVPIHDDIKTLTKAKIYELTGETDSNRFILTGGVPCQPASVAGKRRGTKDDRWLWGEALRVVRELHPTFVLFENVPGLISLEGGLPFEQTLLDLEAQGYETITFSIPACAVDAPHIRQRIWIVAYSGQLPGGNIGVDKTGENTPGQRATYNHETFGSGGESKVVAYSNSSRLVYGQIKKYPTKKGQLAQRDISTASYVADTDSAGRQTGYEWNFSGNKKFFARAYATDGEHWLPESRLGRVANGIPFWLDEPDIPRVATGVPDRANRLKALGNAVVPVEVQAIGEIIKEWIS